jgi:ABC-type polar amino acid transport system, ATPase component
MRQAPTQIPLRYNLFSPTSITLGPLKMPGMDRNEARDKGMGLLSRIGLTHKADEYSDRIPHQLLLSP